MMNNGHGVDLLRSCLFITMCVKSTYSFNQSIWAVRMTIVLFVLVQSISKKISSSLWSLIEFDLRMTSGNSSKIFLSWGRVFTFWVLFSGIKSSKLLVPNSLMSIFVELIHEVKIIVLFIQSCSLQKLLVCLWLTSWNFVELCSFLKRIPVFKQVGVC